MTRCPSCNQLIGNDQASKRAAGGLAVVAKYGAAHMAEIGKRGGRPRKPRFTRKDMASQRVVSGIQKKAPGLTPDATSIDRYEVNTVAQDYQTKDYRDEFERLIAPIRAAGTPKLTFRTISRLQRSYVLEKYADLQFQIDAMGSCRATNPNHARRHNFMAASDRLHTYITGYEPQREPYNYTHGMAS